MKAQRVRKLMFRITFPVIRRQHVHPVKLHSLARQQLPDMEVIDTIEHLFQCPRCFETYRFIRTSYQAHA